jgi:hypothetical protein
VESRDGPRESAQIVAASPFSLDGTMRWLSAGASQRGWVGDAVFGDAAARQRGSKAAYWTKDGQELVVTVEAVDRGASSIVMHYVHSRAGR